MGRSTGITALLALTLVVMLHTTSAATRCAGGKWVRYANETIVGYNRKQIVATGGEGPCIVACETEETFVCKSVTYSAAEQQCDLSEVDRTVAGLQIETVAGVDIYQWECPSTECNIYPCKNGAKCEQFFSDYYCGCVDFHKGKNCDKDEREASKKALDYFSEHPEYPVLIGFGIIGLLLIITAVVVLCTSGSPKGKEAV